MYLGSTLTLPVASHSNRSPNSRNQEAACKFMLLSRCDSGLTHNTPGSIDSRESDRAVVFSVGQLDLTSQIEVRTSYYRFFQRYIDTALLIVNSN